MLHPAYKLTCGCTKAKAKRGAYLRDTTSVVNRLINRYEVFCRFTSFKWLPPSQLCACANSVTTCKMDASESRSYLQPIVSPLCGNISVSKRTTALKGSRAICTLCRQKVAHGGGTTNLKNHLRTKYRLMYIR